MHKERKRISLEIRPIPLWGMLICGIIVTLVGVYLYTTGNVAGGNFRVATGRGQRFLPGPIVITGISTIAVGGGICIFPIYQLIKNFIHKKDVN